MRKLAFILALVAFLASASFASSFYKQVNITNNICEGSTPYCLFEIPITLNGSLSNGSDIRVYSDTSATTEFNYWRMDSWDYTNAKGRLFVNASNGTSTLYVFYNTSMADKSQIKDVGICSDDFNDGTVNTSLWSNTATDTESGGLYHYGTRGTIASRLYSSCSLQSVDFTVNTTYNALEVYYDFADAPPPTSWGTNIWYRVASGDFVAMNGGDTNRGLLTTTATPYIVRYKNPASGNANLSVYNSGYAFILGIAGTPSGRSITYAPLAFAGGSIDFNYYIVGNHFATDPTFVIGAQVKNSSAPPSSANISVTLNSPANGYNSTNATVLLNYSVNFTQYTNVTVVLYINNTAYANNTTAANKTYSFQFAANYNSYSWYVFAYNTSSIAQNATSATNTFTIYYLLNATQQAPATGATQQNKTVFFAYAVNSTLPSSINATLYLDGSPIITNVSASNTTYNNSYSTTFGVHSWYIRVQDATNASRFNTTGNYTFEISFSVTANSPSNNTILAGNTANLIYQTSNLHPINCTAYIDASAINTQEVASSSTINVLQVVADGSHNWQVKCVANESPSYVRNSSILFFAINFSSFNAQLNLTATPENVLASPQAMFYDTNGNLNVLYYTDEANGTSTVRIKTISNNAVINAANATMPAPLQFFVLFRQAGKSTILALNASDTTQGFLLDFAGDSLNISTITFPHANTHAITAYDPYTYDYTRQFSALSLSASSYYLFATPVTGGGFIDKFNGTAVSQAVAFPNGRTPSWQTIANSSDLRTWLYLAPVDTGGGNSNIGLFSFNGTNSTAIATVDSANYTTAIDSSLGGFERFSNKTYAYVSNLSSQMSIYLVEENKSYAINESIVQPSHFLFTDQYTFVFFVKNGTLTNAYSCYFESTPDCIKFSSAEYGSIVPFERGFMATATRTANNNDIIARGAIQSSSVVSLFYNLNTYDMKFLCYDEKVENRLLFTEKVITNTTSTFLTKSTWGYVLPSASVGPGQKFFYSTCLNGTQRLFLSGLTGNFSAELYSLNLSQGVYYAFTVKDRFGVPIQGVKVSLLRLINFKQAWTVIEQCLSDFNGGCTFFLEPFNPYKILIEATGYATQYVDFVPSSVTSINIALDPQSQSFALPNYVYALNDLTIGLGPANTTLTNATNISYGVSSNASILEYFGMAVFQSINGTRTQVFTQNVTGQPSGGVIDYPISQTGRYDVQIWAKIQNFSEYQPTAKAFTIVNASGLMQARSALQAQNYFSPWALYFFGVVVTMVVSGFVSRYTIDGAGIVAVIVLWGFTWLTWGGVIANLGGMAITTTMVTLLTTLGVVAALYMRYSAQTGG